MEYVTSRGFALPRSGDELAAQYWFNLWRIRLWPYRELLVGDTLYWYESATREMVWESRVAELERFPYRSKSVVEARLTSRFGDFDAQETYFLEGPGDGFCLAYKVRAVRRLSLPKPEGLRFPRQGWLRVDAHAAEAWLGKAGVEDRVTLDVLAPAGSLLRRLEQLNTRLAEVAPERCLSVVRQTIRRDTAIVKALKALCGYRCQFPHCGVRIRRRDGGHYVEVAHVEPIRKGGRSVIGNLLVLCPNHHKEFDVGETRILEQTVECVRGTLNGRAFEIRLPPGAAVKPPQQGRRSEGGRR